ncbi:MAG: hypothetical protein CMO16_07110 [Thaumarchaeota archaeon]|nr:hypothetical protein [Nitrososphaerota archaeon]|tara:strand:- start:300 stop:602 length:303 start_codon:yes stop_codon:yes gene_type:complete
MDVWYFKCSNCEYEKKLTLGTYDLEQTFTDLNEDFVYYKLFICKKENMFVTGNIYDNHFDNRCLTDGSELVPVEESQPKKCPKCNTNILVEKIDLSEVIG